ncbi:glycerol dehydrogenase [Clostridium sp. MF28]|uniref:glycerol dehydrogenase n=1 Tax=Clostridium TaxID=1485 RepID=UPI000CF90368|nr:MULTISPECIES: glycerol dehydrogenase [Clostridium]AVK46846.1 glycerol dehydrogenase [Clostridium sp. MF28]PSM59477.1 glycerol dehydrogenase [Clostridium diolis]
MAKIMIAPSKYIQGNGELKNIAEYVSVLGEKALCLISESGLKRVKNTIDKSFETKNIGVKYDLFNGECSITEVNRIIKICDENQLTVLIGIGGGKIIDTIKAVGYYANLPVVIVPTIAATDAPCSALSVLYTDDGVFDKYLFLKQNPNIVLVDTGIIAKAPVRLLVSGMGDALATYFEARACEKSNAGTCAFGTTTITAQALARLCYDTLITEGYKAKLAVEEGVCTKSVEKIVEANTLLSGLGFESGGIAAAHAIHNGLTVLPACHHMYHGEKVAFGTLAQLVLENAPMDEIEEVLDFCTRVGLPVTLKQLGIDEIKPEEIMEVAKAATSKEDTAHNMPFEVTPEDVYAAILTANRLGQEYM